MKRVKRVERGGAGWMKGWSGVERSVSGRRREGEAAEPHG